MPTFVNGQRSDSVTTADRGLNYGDGVFETIAVSFGAPLLLQAHLQRLLVGARLLGLPAPDAVALEAEVHLISHGIEHAVLKILLTAGNGGRGYARAPAISCNRILSLHPFPHYPLQYWHTGVDVTVCRTRLALQPALAGIKHCNRLEQVLARREFSGSDVAEGLLCDMHGMLAEGTMSNVFAVRERQLLTPSLRECGVHGVMREAVLGLAKAAGYRVIFQDAALEAWLQADEVFLTNSVVGIWPVRRIDAIVFEPGTVTRDLQSRLIAGQFAPPLALDSD